MSIFEEERQKKPVSHEIGSDLSAMSADELALRIRLLHDEIARLDEERQRSPPAARQQKPLPIDSEEPPVTTSRPA